MSRRFGRNQKRRMRAAIEQLELENQAQVLRTAAQRIFFEADARSVRQSRDKACHHLQFVLEALQRFRRSALVAPHTEAAPGDPREPLQADVSPLDSRLDSVLAMHDMDTVSLCAVMRIEDLYAIHAYVEENVMELAREVHFFCEGRGKFAGAWSYHVSDRTLQSGLNSSTREDIARRIARDLLANIERTWRSTARG